METIESQTLKFTACSQKKAETLKLFSYRPSYRFCCDNCNNKILESVMFDFIKLLPDNKLTCPICMSLAISEVNE